MALVASLPAASELLRLAAALPSETINLFITKVVELATEALRTGLSIITVAVEAAKFMFKTGVDGVVRLATVIATAVVEIVRSGERVLLQLTDLVERGVLQLSISNQQRHLHAQ